MTDTHEKSRHLLRRIGVIAAALLLAACTTHSSKPAFLVADASADASTIEIVTHLCGQHLIADVVETADEVIITITADTTDDGECKHRLTISLGNPLKGRRVVDGISGMTVANGAPTPTPGP